MTSETWAPAISLDLDDISGKAFQDALATFDEKTSQQPRPELPGELHEGWCDITPEIAEHLLRRNKMNRKVSLETVRKYARRMKAGDWRKTGQAVLLSDEELYDGQHRLWAGYLSGITFPSYVIMSVPEQSDLFAFIDDGKSRNGGDGLVAAGLNGLSPTIAATVNLAFRYSNGALGVVKAPPIRTLDNIEVIAYTRLHPDLAPACHDAVSNFSRATGVIGNKGVACFAAWKIMEMYGRRRLEQFYLPLGSGANLAEDDPVLALRNRLMRSSEGIGNDLRPLHRLALIIKGFNMHIDNQTVNPKRGLYMRDNEKFPLFEDRLPQAEAAE